MTGRSPPRPLRALVTDIDGTITDSARHLSLPAVRLLRGLEARGIPVVLATGNVLPIALAIHRSLGLSGPVVAENGGLLYQRKAGVDHVERLADRRIAWRAYRRLRDEGVLVRRLFTDRWRETEVALEPDFPVSLLRSHLKGAKVRVEGTGYAVHLMQFGAGKREALAPALASLGIDISDCLVAGDGDNDVDMLKAAGLGVSFSSGSPAARRAAGLVARLPFGDGFVEALMHRDVVHRWIPRPGRLT
jgi:phosphoglycolate phosphatase (TIGR01487 family)